MYKQIKNYDNYLINEEGIIINQHTGRILKQKIVNTNKNKTGNTRLYYQVNLSNSGKIKTIYVHRLVAETFIDNKENYPCINHINNNSLDNSIENLEWCSYAHNQQERRKLEKNKNN